MSATEIKKPVKRVSVYAHEDAARLLRQIAEHHGGLSDSSTILSLIYQEARRLGLPTASGARRGRSRREQEEISEQPTDYVAP